MYLRFRDLLQVVFMMKLSAVSTLTRQTPHTAKGWCEPSKPGFGFIRFNQGGYPGVVLTGHISAIITTPEADLVCQPSMLKLLRPLVAEPMPGKEPESDRLISGLKLVKHPLRDTRRPRSRCQGQE